MSMAFMVGHLTTCWLTAILIGLTIILVSMMMFAVSLKPGTNILTARCKNRHIFDKRDVSTAIHLVHGPRSWHQCQLNTLKEIAETFQEADINLIIIQNETDFKDINNSEVKFKELHQTKDLSSTGISTSQEHNTELGRRDKLKNNQTISLILLKRMKPKNEFRPAGNKPRRRKRFYPWEKIQLNVSIGARKLLKMYLQPAYVNRPRRKVFNGKTLALPTTTNAPKVQTLQQLLETHPKIRVIRLTYEEVFKESPLLYYFQNMNEATRLFSIRVLQIWNYGGITFDLPELHEASVSSETSSTKASIAVSSNVVTLKAVKITIPPANDNIKKYNRLIRIGMSSFENLPEGLVTIDEKGLHMETKSICHAFFGDILMNLRKVTQDSMPDDVILKTLQEFCRRGSVDGQYCKKFS